MEHFNTVLKFKQKNFEQLSGPTDLIWVDLNRPLEPEEQEAFFQNTDTLNDLYGCCEVEFQSINFDGSDQEMHIEFAEKYPLDDVLLFCAILEKYIQTLGEDLWIEEISTE